MGHTQALNVAIARGVAYLQTNQLPDGSFQACAWHAAGSIQPQPVAMPSLIASHIMLALGNTKHGGAQAITHRLALWIKAHEDVAWINNRTSKLTSERYDLYSTFSGLLALQQHSTRSISAAALGSVAHALVHAESQVGGPYYTSTSPGRKTLDIAGNCAINRFIAAVAEPLPNITVLLKQATQDGHLDSSYHPFPLATVYQLAWAYPLPDKRPLARQIIGSYQAGNWRTALEAALGISSLATLRTPIPEEAVLALLGQQLPNGSWAAAPYYHHPHQPFPCYGADALTTAYALEALSGYILQQQTRRLSRTKVQSVSPPSDTLYKAVITRAHQQTATLPYPLKRTIRQMVAHIQRADKNQEIILLPLFTAQSLYRPRAFSNDAFMYLGLANLYNWMAYTIYDDFLDDEGEPPLLPVANVALRYSLEAFRQALPASPRFQQLVASTFDSIDAANAWEIARCRFAVTDNAITLGKLPAYGRRSRLAERSLSHSLPALGILVLAGLDPHDARVIACQTAFKHYLIARQLNDDMHDWEEDVCAGHISYVVRNILEELNLPPGSMPLSKLIPRMKRQFWNATLARTCRDITEHTTRGRRALQRSKLLNELNIISKLLDGLDGVVAHTLAERERAEEFLRGYRRK